MVVEFGRNPSCVHGWREVLDPGVQSLGQVLRQNKAKVVGACLLHAHKTNVSLHAVLPGR